MFVARFVLGSLLSVLAEPVLRLDVASARRNVRKFRGRECTQGTMKRRQSPPLFVRSTADIGVKVADVVTVLSLELLGG
mgnify:CR=1 FL=1